MKNLIVSIPMSIGLLVLCAAPAHADRHAEIAQIRAELRALSARLEALEAQEAQQPVEAAPTVAAAPAPKMAGGNWSDKMRLSGDLRYRHETIDQQGSDERTRQRVRARIGLDAKLSETVSVGVRLATGSDSPVSANQSFDNGFSTKDFGLDRAYVSVKPTPRTEIRGGKMSNPLLRAGGSSLIWDSDVSPEGLAWRFKGDNLFVNAAGLWVEERSGSSDSLLFAAQAGYSVGLADGSQLVAGAGYYDYSATQGRTPFYNGDPNGNTVDEDGNYVFDYNLTELFAHWSTTLSDMPFSAYANWVKNGDASSRDTGWTLGGIFGKASAPGSWQLGYFYRDLEADAVVATFTDSNVGGGGTGVRGHVLNARYAFNKHLLGSLTYFINENRIDTAGERDYNRLQADVSVKY